jgi:hypothetical protein
MLADPDHLNVLPVEAAVGGPATVRRRRLLDDSAGCVR